MLLTEVMYVLPMLTEVSIGRTYMTSQSQLPVSVLWGDVLGSMATNKKHIFDDTRP